MSQTREAPPTPARQLASTDGWQRGPQLSCYHCFVSGCLNYEGKTYFTPLPQGSLIQKKTNQEKLSCA